MKPLQESTLKEQIEVLQSLDGVRVSKRDSNTIQEFREQLEAGRSLCFREFYDLKDILETYL